MGDRYQSQTYYELLEITPSAGPAEIYNAYQKARATYSTSSPALYSMFTPEEAQQLMALIEEAYQTLSHQARRREYDQKIGIGTAKAQPAYSSAAANSGFMPSVFNPPPPPLPPNAVKQNVNPDLPPPVPPPPPTAAPVNRTPPPPPPKREDTWVGPVKITTKKEELPPGFARTKFSVYEINPALEQEIESVEECDGRFLQKIRLYKGVTLDQMSDEIRITKTTLVALESNDLDMLPAAVFTRGFVTQIARLLCVNERKVTDAYMKFFKANKK